MAYAKEPITPQVQMDVLPTLIQRHPRYKDTICCDFCGDDSPIYVYRTTRFSSGERVPLGTVALRWAACKLCSVAVDKDDWEDIARRLRPRLNVVLGKKIGMIIAPERLVRAAIQRAIDDFKEAAIPV